MKTNNKLANNFHLIGLLVLATFVNQSASASSINYLNHDSLYDVHKDGTYIEETNEAILLEDTQGVRQFAQFPITYSESLQTLEVLDAHTITKDGRRLDVTTDRIITQQAPQSTTSPMYSDLKVKIIVFPQVEPGSELHIHYKRTQLKPNLPDVFSIREVFPRTIDITHASVTIRAPIGLQLQFDCKDVQGGELDTTVAGMRMWQWHLDTSLGAPAEMGAVNDADFSPYVAVSNLNTYNDLAKAYSKGVEASAKITPLIQKKADEITHGVDDKKKQAEVLYQWVSKNVRYVAIFLNMGGYIPHPAEEILKEGYGDCKDHATLLQALLAAKGIKSSQALIEGTNAYSITKVPVLESFNHVITYLPDFHMFIDSTSGLAQFGVLSDTTRDKPTLIVNSGGGKAELMRTSPVDAEHDRDNVVTKATLSTNGTLTGTSHIQAFGVFDLLHRAIISVLPKPQLGQIITQVLARLGQNGTGNLTFGDPRDLTLAFNYDADFQLPARSSLPGPGALPTTAGLGSFVGIEAFAKSQSLAERKFDFMCTGGSRQETTEIQLPNNLNVTALPKSMEAKSSFGSYNSSYELQNHTLKITRMLTIKTSHANCSSKEYFELRALLNAVNKDLQAMVLYQ